MYGLEAIAEVNGWAMALAGATIVMLGLAILSFVISQLHKVAALLDRWEAAREQKRDPGSSAPAAVPEIQPATPGLDLSDPGGISSPETLGHYRSLTDKLGESFSLAALYRASREHDLPHPHLSIRSLREAGMLIPRGEGIFSWQRPKENR